MLKEKALERGKRVSRTDKKADGGALRKSASTNAGGGASQRKQVQYFPKGVEGESCLASVACHTTDIYVPRVREPAPAETLNRLADSTKNF